MLTRGDDISDTCVGAGGGGASLAAGRTSIRAVIGAP